MKLEILQQILEKLSNSKFHENPSRGSRVVPCERTDGWTDRRTNMTKLIVPVHNFANAPNNDVKRWFRWRNILMGTILSNLFFPLCTFILENIYKAVLKLYVMWGWSMFFIEMLQNVSKKSVWKLMDIFWNWAWVTTPSFFSS